MTQKPRRQRGKGALAVIGSILIASSVLRFAVGASTAIAREDGDAAPAVAQAKDTSGTLETAANGDTTEMPAFIAEDQFAPLLLALQAREARVAKRETDIKIRMQALSAAETEIDAKLAALETAEQKLRATLALAQNAAENDLTRLTDVYAKMKPKQAAALFEEMDPEFSAGFLARMKPDVAAAIMAGLSPNVAYTISVVLAGRNANVPKQ